MGVLSKKQEDFQDRAIRAIAVTAEASGLE